MIEQNTVNFMHGLSESPLESSADIDSIKQVLGTVAAEMNKQAKAIKALENRITKLENP